MSDFMFDFKKIFDMRVEASLMQQKEVRPLVKMLKKYGIEGMQAVSFLADLATVCQQLPKKEDSE